MSFWFRFIDVGWFIIMNVEVVVYLTQLMFDLTLSNEYLITSLIEHTIPCSTDFL